MQQLIIVQDWNIINCSMLRWSEITMLLSGTADAMTVSSSSPSRTSLPVILCVLRIARAVSSEPAISVSCRCLFNVAETMHCQKHKLNSIKILDCYKRKICSAHRIVK